MLEETLGNARFIQKAAPKVHCAKKHLKQPNIHKPPATVPHNVDPQGVVNIPCIHQRLVLPVLLPVPATVVPQQTVIGVDLLNRETEKPVLLGDVPLLPYRHTVPRPPPMKFCPPRSDPYPPSPLEVWAESPRSHDSPPLSPMDTENLPLGEPWDVELPRSPPSPLHWEPRHSRSPPSTEMPSPIMTPIVLSSGNPVGHETSASASTRIPQHQPESELNIGANQVAASTRDINAEMQTSIVKVEGALRSSIDLFTSLCDDYLTPYLPNGSRENEKVAANSAMLRSPQAMVGRRSHSSAESDLPSSNFTPPEQSQGGLATSQSVVLPYAAGPFSLVQTVRSTTKADGVTNVSSLGVPPLSLVQTMQPLHAGSSFTSAPPIRVETLPFLAPPSMGRGSRSSGAARHPAPPLQYQRHGEVRIANGTSTSNYGSTSGNHTYATDRVFPRVIFPPSLSHGFGRSATALPPRFAAERQQSERKTSRSRSIRERPSRGRCSLWCSGGRNSKSSPSPSASTTVLPPTSSLRVHPPGIYAPERYSQSADDSDRAVCDASYASDNRIPCDPPVAADRGRKETAKETIFSFLSCCNKLRVEPTVSDAALENTLRCSCCNTFQSGSSREPINEGRGEGNKQKSTGTTSLRRTLAMPSNPTNNACPLAVATKLCMSCCNRSCNTGAPGPNLAPGQNHKSNALERGTRRCEVESGSQLTIPMRSSLCCCNYSCNRSAGTSPTQPTRIRTCTCRRDNKNTKAKKKASIKQRYSVETKEFALKFPDVKMQVPVPKVKDVQLMEANTQTPKQDMIYVPVALNDLKGATDMQGQDGA